MDKKEYKPQRKIHELYSKEAERNLLCCVLLCDCMDFRLDDIFNAIQPEAFSEIHQLIYLAMLALYKKSIKIDFVTLTETLERNGSFDKIGGFNYLTTIAKCEPSAVNYKHYKNIILDYSRRRKYEKLGYFLSNAVYDKESSDKLKAELEAQISAIDAEGSKEDIEHISVAVKQEQERMVKIFAGEYDDFGLPTGFPILDKTLWGLQKSDLIIVGARSGVGKTAMALNILNHCANVNKKKCLFFSLEMPKSQIVIRLLSLISGIDSTEIKKIKDLTADDVDNLKKAQQLMLDGGLHIDDTSNNTVQAMSLKAKYLQRKEGLDLVVVDYLQFVKPLTKSGNRFQDVGEIARELKVMARQLNVPVIALCQLNRGLDNESREPTLSDLRESGEIENNADIVAFLNPKGSKFEKVRTIDLIIGKFRNGQMRIVPLEYQGNILRFKELEKNAEMRRQEKIPIDKLKPIQDDDLPFPLDKE